MARTRRCADAMAPKRKSVVPKSHARRESALPHEDDDPKVTHGDKLPPSKKKQSRIDIRRQATHGTSGEILPFVSFHNDGNAVPVEAPDGKIAFPLNAPGMGNFAVSAKNNDIRAGRMTLG